MLEVERFLGAHAPFRGLPDDVLAQVAAAVIVEFFPTGTVVLEQGGRPSEFLFVLRRGKVELVDGDSVVDRLDEGEAFGFPSLLAGSPPQYTVRVAEDALCYLFDRSVAVDILGAPTGIRFLVRTLRSRRAPQHPSAAEPYVQDVARGPLVFAEPKETIESVARRMTSAAASAAVVELPDGPGIVTDHDFRSRVVADGAHTGMPIEQVTTRRALTIARSSLVSEALLKMLESGVHHLPVVDGSGAVVAMLSDLDLLGLERRNSSRLRSEIQHAADVDQLAAAGQAMPDSVATLVQSGVDACHVAKVVSVLIDALTTRLLELGVETLGPAPTPFVWLALGSAGRREQALVTDQDHALISADSAEDHDDYFLGLSRFVVAGLEAAGIPRCSSKVMASEDGWRGPETWWRRRMADWMTEADRVAAFLTGIAFDVRAVAGNLTVDSLFAEAADAASRQPAFLRRLERLALEVRPPLGLFGGLLAHDVDGREVLDLKMGGLLPITELGRLYALQAGAFELATPARLRAAAVAGTLSSDHAEGLEEAFGFLQDLRLRNQVTQWTSGQRPSNLIDPDGLGPIDRAALKQAFRIVRDIQSDLANRLAPRILGR
ncbi:MAG TPA: DUF294 nucleotidyltransferase-like domain-containing protein [Acidimicrobiia bacterium]|nr:DUF294 nucleotidyltransferase-like domain-containing protein [Acidimicrobiia bacterium]